MITPLEEKEEHFHYINLLDISDDETDFPDQGFRETQQLLEEYNAVPQRVYRKSSSFLGPTPKERKAEFERHSRERREAARSSPQGLSRAETAPTVDIASSFLSATLEQPGRKSKLKRNASLSNLPPRRPIEVPFYKRVGVLPRELKIGKPGKIVKLAENIKLAPEHRQALKGCVICKRATFFTTCEF